MFTPSQPAQRVPSVFVLLQLAASVFSLHRLRGYLYFCTSSCISICTFVPIPVGHLNCDASYIRKRLVLEDRLVRVGIGGEGKAEALAPQGRH
jgi:hypothetical protein